MEDSWIYFISIGIGIYLAYRLPAYNGFIVDLRQESKTREPKSTGRAGSTSTGWQNQSCGDCLSSSASHPGASRADQNCRWACCQSYYSKGSDVATGGRGRWWGTWQDFSLLLALLRTKSFHSPVAFSSVRLRFLIEEISWTKCLSWECRFKS